MSGPSEPAGQLDRYRQMRDFTSTPEPSGAPIGDPPDPDRPRFVIQQHDATRLHWDLRLEHGGALRSFALPRGLPWNPDEDRLAVHTEDHPIEYLEFHGQIPSGEYGAGTMTIWDRGTYEPEKMRDDGVTVVLEGERIRGRYALFPIDGRNWMIHRTDPPQDPDRRPIPEDLRPMEPVVGSLPTGGWAYEIRWVGARTLLTNDAGHVTLTGTDGSDLSDAFPEIRRIGRAIGALESILDGIVVAVDRDRRPVADRRRVRERLDASDAGSDSRVRRLSQDRPCAIVLVDLLWMEGHPATDLAYRDRRQLLEELGLRGAAWQTPGYHVGDAAALTQAAEQQGLPGLIAKRLDSPYRPGTTSDDWVQRGT